MSSPLERTSNNVGSSMLRYKSNFRARKRTNPSTNKPTHLILSEEKTRLPAISLNSPFLAFDSSQPKEMFK